MYGCLGSSFEQPSGSSLENEESQSQHHLWLYGGNKVLPESFQRWIMLFKVLRQQDWNFRRGKTIGKWSNGIGFCEISDQEIKQLANNYISQRPLSPTTSTLAICFNHVL
jgi:hypothetical protein